MKEINGNEYLNTLTQGAEKEVLSEIKTELENRGFEGVELEEAVENAADSKLADLSELISLERIQQLVNKY